MFKRIVYKNRVWNFQRRPATLNFWIDQFETHIRVQEAKLHQNHTSVEKIFFFVENGFHPTYASLIQTSE